MWWIRGALLTLLILCGAPGAWAAPAEVTVGSYVKQVRDLDFKSNKYTVDFFIWFRWQAVGPLADYKPLESFEIVNGTEESKTSVVEKTVGDVRYASARIVATMSEPWELASYPFDRHRVSIHIEDSGMTTQELVFVADQANSRLGDEMNIAGWNASRFGSQVSTKVYHSNYGDPSLPGDARSDFSRFAFSFDLDRQSFGSALKLLSTVLLATAVAFVAFLVKPSDLDARFGMGVGSLFAVAASAFIAASSVPDSGVMTVADNIHMVALAFIFGTLLISAVCLKLEVTDREALALRIDRLCVLWLPLLFYGWAAWAVYQALR